MFDPYCCIAPLFHNSDASPRHVNIKCSIGISERKRKVSVREYMHSCLPHVSSRFALLDSYLATSFSQVYRLPTTPLKHGCHLPLEQPAITRQSYHRLQKPKVIAGTWKQISWNIIDWKHGCRKAGTHPYNCVPKESRESDIRRRDVMGRWNLAASS